MRSSRRQSTTAARAIARVRSIGMRGSCSNPSSQTRARVATSSMPVNSSTSPMRRASLESTISPATSRRSARCGPTIRASSDWMPSGATSPTCVSFKPIRYGPSAMTR